MDKYQEWESGSEVVRVENVLGLSLEAFWEKTRILLRSINIYLFLSIHITKTRYPYFFWRKFHSISEFEGVDGVVFDKSSGFPSFSQRFLVQSRLFLNSSKHYAEASVFIAKKRILHLAPLFNFASWSTMWGLKRLRVYCTYRWRPNIGINALRCRWGAAGRDSSFWNIPRRTEPSGTCL